MWWEIFTFEIRYQLRRPLLPISSVIFFLSATALMASPAAGAIYVLGGGVERNAPALIFVYTAVFSIIGLFIVTAFVANSVLRDFEQGTYPFFFTRPIRKFDYLLGRFAGSMAVSAVLFLAVAAGMFAAQFVPGQELANIGPYRIWPYLASWAIIALPNLLVMGACLFSIAIWKRRAIWIYLFVVLYMLLQDVVESIASRMSNTLLGSLLEPTGLGAISSVTRYWSSSEMNLLVPAFSGELLLNRLVWLTIATLVFGLAYWRFRYTDSTNSAKLRAFKPGLDHQPTSADTAKQSTGPKPVAKQHFSFKTYFSQWTGQTRVELKGVVNGIPFIILLLLSLVFVFTFAWFIGQNRGTPVWPLTYLMLRAIQMSMATFLTVTLIFYGGELLWRERGLRFSDVYDALPVPNTIFLFSKLTALAFIAAIFIGTSIISTVTVQLIRGCFSLKFTCHHRTSNMYIDYFHLSDIPIRNHFTCMSKISPGTLHVTGLKNAIIFPGGSYHCSALCHSKGQGFFTINIFPGFCCIHSHHGVPVIRCRNYHSINIFSLKQLPVIFIGINRLGTPVQFVLIGLFSFCFEPGKFFLVHIRGGQDYGFWTTIDTTQ